MSHTQDAHADRLTLSLELHLTALQIFQIQPGCLISCITDENLAGSRLGGEPRGDVDMIAQRGEIRRVILATHYTNVGRPRVDADPDREPRPFCLAVSGKLEQLLSRLDRPARVLRAG